MVSGVNSGRSGVTRAGAAGLRLLPVKPFTAPTDGPACSSRTFCGSNAIFVIGSDVPGSVDIGMSSSSRARATSRLAWKFGMLNFAATA